MAFLNFSPRCFAEAAGSALALPAALVTFGNKLTEVAASQELELWVRHHQYWGGRTHTVDSFAIPMTP
jgi:hypothetical protein